MKKITYLCFADIKYPVNGYFIRTNYIIDKLKKDGNEATVIQFGYRDSVEDYNGNKLLTLKLFSIHDLKWNFLPNFFGTVLLDSFIFNVQSFFKLRKYSKIIKDSEEVYIGGCLLLFPFILTKLYKKRIVMEAHCINKDVAIKMKIDKPVIGTIRQAIWHVIENYCLNFSDHIIVITENDKTFIIDNYGIDPSIIQVVPHVVSLPDANKYLESSRNIRNESIGNYNKIALFVGDLGAIHNKDAEEFIRLKLAPETPEIKYLFVGNNPSRLVDQNNLQYLGYVDSVDPYIIMSDFCIAPLNFGGGTKTKVLDYLKYNKKTYTTRVGMEGIDDNDNVTVCEMSDFVKTIKSTI